MEVTTCDIVLLLWINIVIYNLHLHDAFIRILNIWQNQYSYKEN